MPIIANAYVTEVEEVGSILTIQTSRDDGEYHTELETYIQHYNYDIQAKGQRVLHSLASMCDICAIADAKQFIGKQISHMQFDELRRLDPQGRLPSGQVAPLMVLPSQSSNDHGDRFVYVISCVNSTPDLCKIGIANSAEKRVKTLATASPHPLRLELARRADNAREIEWSAHTHFAQHRRNGEWFEMPATAAIQFINSAIDGVSA